MHVDITKRDGKLMLENVSCDCAYDHRLPEMDIYIKSGLAGQCADCIAQSGLGKNVLIIADSNTYEVAAKTIEKNLTGAGIVCRVCILPGQKIEPTPMMTEHILSMVNSDTEFMLSVGSGVITDLTRRSAFLAKLPFAVFGTAASMDGYTSITSSMMIDGMKVSKYGESAKLLMFDPAILACAPLMMQAAGVGDVFAKYNVLVDWKLGSAVADEIFCPLCESLLKTALDGCASNIDEILKRSQKGMEALIESLILAGLTVLIVRYTRPVASVEHNMSHYWEMMKLAYGGHSPSHGIGVGIGLIYSLLFHDMLKSTDISKIDKQKIKENRMTKEQKKAFITSYYPPSIGNEVFEANKYWYLEWCEQEKRIDALIAYHSQYKKDCDILPDYKDIIKYFTLFGAPTSAAKAGIDKERLKKTLLCTKDYRPRYSIAEALSELGMLEECTQRILDMEKDL